MKFFEEFEAFLNNVFSAVFDFKYEDFTLEGYDPHPPIKGKVAV